MFDFGLTTNSSPFIVSSIPWIAVLGNGMSLWCRFVSTGGRIPRDGKTEVTRQRTIESAIFYSSAACCGAGIVLALVFLQYNLYHRKLKSVVVEIALFCFGDASFV